VVIGDVEEGTVRLRLVLVATSAASSFCDILSSSVFSIEKRVKKRKIEV